MLLYLIFDLSQLRRKEKLHTLVSGDFSPEDHSRSQSIQILIVEIQRVSLEENEYEKREKNNTKGTF